MALLIFLVALWLSLTITQFFVLSPMDIYQFLGFPRFVSLGIILIIGAWILGGPSLPHDR